MGSLFDQLMAPAEKGNSWRDKFNNGLSVLEKHGADMLGVRDLLRYSDSRPSELGFADDPGGGGGPEDAVRHLLLSAELHRTRPMIANLLLYGHELGTNILQGQSVEDRNQDLFNNNLGRDIGLKAKSREDVERLVLDAVKSGKASLQAPLPLNAAQAKDQRIMQTIWPNGGKQ